MDQSASQSASLSKHKQSIEQKLKEFEEKSWKYEQLKTDEIKPISSEPRAEEWRLKA